MTVVVIPAEVEVATATEAAAAAMALVAAAADFRAEGKTSGSERSERDSQHSCVAMKYSTSARKDRCSGSAGGGKGSREAVVVVAVGGLDRLSAPTRISRSSSFSSRQMTSNVDSRSTSADGCGILADAGGCWCGGGGGALPPPPLLALGAGADCVTDLDAVGELLPSSSSELHMAYTVRRRF